MPTVLITETLDAEPARWLSERASLLWCPLDQPEKLHALLPTAHALIVRTYTHVNPALLDLAPNLRVVARAGVGLDNIDLPACKARNIPVVYTPDANTQAVVEYVTSLIIDSFRPRESFSSPITTDHFHHLRKTRVGAQLDSLTLGVLGLGRIGSRVAHVAHALNLKILVNDLLPESHFTQQLSHLADSPSSTHSNFRDFRGFRGFRGFVDKPTLYRNADILTIHVDGRPENKHLINSQALAQLKPSCLLINTARGFLIDNHALADWARTNAPSASGGGARAILDVHDPEPPPPDYPLYNLPNVQLFPHLASRTRQALLDMSWVVRDVAAVLEGKPPQFPAY